MAADECQACGKHFEVAMAMADDDRLKEQPPTCPECGSWEPRQMVSAFNCKRQATTDWAS